MSKRTDIAIAKDLRRAVGDALSLIERDGLLPDRNAVSTPAGTILDQCRVLVEKAAQRRTEPVRTIHHMACAGGTLISRFISALPNTVLISEVDPLSDLHLRRAKKPFFPTDLIADLRYSPREIVRDIDIAVFTAGLSALRQELEKTGQRLVLRDHSHSRYHASPDPSARLGLRDIVEGLSETLSVVTVRNPLDSYLSLIENDWLHFEPANLDEYCRRYLLFLNDHSGLPIYKYEDFSLDPSSILPDIARDLDLGWSDDVSDLYVMFSLSGDSGRRGFRVAPRKRRPIPDAVQDEVAKSAHFVRLCNELGYPSLVDASKS